MYFSANDTFTKAMEEEEEVSESSSWWKWLVITLLLILIAILFVYSCYIKKTPTKKQA